MFALGRVLCVLCVQRPKVQPPASQAAAARAAAAASLALSVVGNRVEVWWQEDERYYAGRITHYNTGTQYSLLAQPVAAVAVTVGGVRLTYAAVSCKRTASPCSACCVRAVRCVVCCLSLVRCCHSHWQAHREVRRW